MQMICASSGGWQEVDSRAEEPGADLPRGEMSGSGHCETLQSVDDAQ
jgi:hypothetical protein